MEDQPEMLYPPKDEKKECHKGKFLWITLFLSYFVFINITFVSGTSMYPTLQDKDVLIMEKASVMFNNLNRGDIISFKQKIEDKEVFFIKRIIGVPGDHVEIKEGNVYINKKKLDEQYLSKDVTTELIQKDGALDVTLGKNKYFVLGDNRDNSIDSRFEEVGFVPKEKIAAKKLFRVLNLS